jgi:hypothetical protein
LQAESTRALQPALAERPSELRMPVDEVMTRNNATATAHCCRCCCRLANFLSELLWGPANGHDKLFDDRLLSTQLDSAFCMMVHRGGERGLMISGGVRSTAQEHCMQAAADSAAAACSFICAEAQRQEEHRGCSLLTWHAPAANGSPAGSTNTI